MNLSVSGFASSKTVQIRIYNLTTATETVAWTATGVIERANGEGYSTYYYNYAITAGHEYIVDWKDNSSPIKTAAELINIPYVSLSPAGVQAIWDALTSALTTANSIGKKIADWVLGTDSKVILSSDAQAGVTIPTVTTIGSLAAQAKADVNAEVDAALNTTIPGSPTANSINERIAAIDDLTQAAGNGDLTAIKDALTVTTFAVVTDVGNSVLQFKTDLPSVVNDFYKGIWAVPTTGVLVGSGPRKVSTYNGNTKIITLTSGYTSIPADGVIFEVISD